MLQELQNGESRGSSLMQSGGNILPGIAMKVSKFAFDDGLVDEFAALEDEFDGGSVLEHTSARIEVPKGSSTPKRAQTESVLNRINDPYLAQTEAVLNHFNDPSLYIQAFLVIALFVFAAKWNLAPSPKEAFNASDLFKAPVAEPSPENSSKDVGAEPGPNLACSGGNIFAALEKAVRAEDAAGCLQILKQGGRRAVHQEDPCGCTALHVAAHSGSVSMAMLLLNQGAKVDACEAWDETPLHMAARSGSLDLCDLLLTWGANMDAVNAHGWTPLLLAGQAQQEDICELLLSRGAGVGGIADDELPPLVSALLFHRMFTGHILRPSAELESDGSEAAEMM